MTTARAPVRAVYDCAVFVQGLGRRHGVARKCLDLLEAGSVELCASPATLAELEDVLNRPEILRRFPAIGSTSSQALLNAVNKQALLFTDVPKALVLPRDRDDEPYTDLAVRAGASYLVTWNDRHLTYLMRKDTPEGVEFCTRYPAVQIVSPPEFVREVEAACGGATP